MGLFRRTPKTPPPPQLGHPAPPASASAKGPAFSTRSLRLQHPPEIEYAPVHAQSFADAVLRIDGAPLDYSVDSLRVVDDVLGSFEHLGSDAVAETVLTAGFYVGEVMVRQVGYRWTKKPDDVPMWSPFGLLVVGPQGNFSNPLSKAFKRVDNGAGDSVAYFVTAIAASGGRG